METSRWVLEFRMNHCLSVQRVGKETKEEDYKICKRVVDEMISIFSSGNYDRALRSDIVFNTFDGKAHHLHAILGLILFQGMDDKLYCEYDYRHPSGTKTLLQKKPFNRVKRFISSIKKEFKKKNIPMKKAFVKCFKELYGFKHTA